MEVMPTYICVIYLSAMETSFLFLPTTTSSWTNSALHFVKPQSRQNPRTRTPEPESAVNMSEMISSIETIVFSSGAIITSAVLLWCLWKTFGFVGFPIGKMIMRIAKQDDPENPSSNNHRSSVFAVSLGGFLCYSLIAYKTISHQGVPRYSIPGQEMYDVGFWLAKLILSACGETVAVLAILSGVVKVAGLDGGRESPIELGKDERRMA